jgi:hypothetical protein
METGVHFNLNDNKTHNNNTLIEEHELYKFKDVISLMEFEYK